MYVYICMYTYIHTYIYTCACSYIHIYTCTCIYVYIQTCTCVFTCIYILYTRICVCTYDALCYGVPTISMLLKMIGLFCKRAP